MEFSLRLTDRQHQSLRSHLFPGDGKEAAAILLCGRRAGTTRHVLVGQEVVPVPHAACSRTADRVTWSTEALEPVLQRAYRQGLAVVKVHSHGVEDERFSTLDDESDRRVLSAVANFLDDGWPHASAVMLPSGRLTARAGTNNVAVPFGLVMVVGDDLRIWAAAQSGEYCDFVRRHQQAFGTGTTNLLRTLSVAVVGCSGTGSIVVEQLARLGVKRLTLIDPKVVDGKNLNRILNSRRGHVVAAMPKALMLAQAIAEMDLGVHVVPLPISLSTREAVMAVAEADVVFGCMDGVEGRHLLNRLATYYTLPYIDVGVRLEADGEGGVEAVAGAVHYLQPGGSSLLSRGVYSMADVEAEELHRTNPELYDRQRAEGYIRGIHEDRPAVISVNMFIAAMAVNEFLARLHPYRNSPNSAFALVAANLAEGALLAEVEGAPCPLLRRHVGRGDVTPLLGRPSLS